MTGKSIAMLLIVVIAALAVILACYYLFPEEPSITQLSFKTPEKEITPPPATGNIDDAVDALLKELIDIESLFEEEEEDVELVTSDELEIGDFGQSIDESEL